jgi:hypothetical protein
MTEHGHGNDHKGGEEEGNRITLVQRQSGLQPRDPGKMAELQVRCSASCLYRSLKKGSSTI